MHGNPRCQNVTIPSGAPRTLRLLFAMICVGLATHAAARNTIVLQLKWHHQFQFAGYYAALEKGFFREEGLAVEIRPTESGRGPLREVLSGGADYAVGDASIVLARLRGSPVVIVTPIFQSSPLALYTRVKDNLMVPAQLKGKTLMIGDPAENISILAMLHEAGVRDIDFTNLLHSYNYDDLFSGKVDAISAYITTAPIYFQSRQRETHAIWPLTYGIDFYGDLLYTSQNEVANHLDRALAMRRAVIRGWQYALDHPEEIVQLIRTRYKCTLSVTDLRYEAMETRKMIRPEYVELGHLSPSRLRRIADVFANEGFVAPDRSLKGLVLDDYMRTDDSVGKRLIALTIGILLAFALSVGLIGINRRLKILVHERTNELRIANEHLQTELAERERAEAELQEAHDLLERRVANRTAQLEAAGRAQEAFSYSVSHDLRGPLRAMDGFSRILIQDYSQSLNAEAKDYLARISEAALRMGALVDDLLKLARINRTELKVTEIDLSELAREIAAELRQSAPEREVTWKIASGISGRGDPVLLRNLLDNLLSNAWKYTGKKQRARIEFGVMPRAEGAAYFVKDDGAGFDMEFSGRLFVAFERLHSDSEFPGSGIGLATVQRIVDLHGGKAWAFGQVDQGATFYFTLNPPA